MQSIACILCQKNNTIIVGRQAIVRKQGQAVQSINVMCRNCGLVFINPRLESQEYESLYQDYGERRHSLNTKEEINAYIKTSLGGPKGEQVAGFLKPYVRHGDAALDVGVGAAAIAMALKDKLGLDVQGIEPGVLLGRTVSEYCRLPVFIGLLENYAQKFSEKKFDLIVLHHVFEHFTLPVETLQLIGQLLRPNGIVYIEVPNVLDFKKPVNQFFDLLHPFSYSPATLNRVLGIGGFKIIDWNKNKRWRIQIAAAFKADSRPAIKNSALADRHVAWRTKWFLYWRRLNDCLIKLIS